MFQFFNSPILQFLSLSTMTPLWAIFTFLNLWWVSVYIVIAFQGQRTDRLKHTVWYTSLLSAGLTASIALLMGAGIIRFV